MGPRLLRQFQYMCTVSNSKKLNSNLETRQVAKFLISMAKYYKISDITALKFFVSSNEDIQKEFGKELIDI